MLRLLAPAVLDLVVPLGCPGCGGRGGRASLCESCSAELQIEPQWASAEPSPPGLPAVASAGVYQGVLRRLILTHKEGGRLALARPLGSALAQAVLLLVGSEVSGLGGSGSKPVRPIALVPIPSRREATRERGHDPLRRTTRAAARTLRQAGLVVRVVPALRLGRRVGDQSGLSAADRWVNLSGALCLRPRLERVLTGHRVILLDDILTTGATLAEAARVLHSAQDPPIDLVGAAVIAATHRRGNSPNGSTLTRRWTSVETWHPSGPVVAPKAGFP